MTQTIIPAHDGYKVFSQGYEQTMQAEPVIAWLIDEDGTITPMSPNGPVVSWCYLKKKDCDGIHRAPRPEARPESETAGGW
jgi:hypothetical protein